MSKYQSLIDHLDRHTDKDIVTMEFSTIEEILRFPLPPSCYRYPQWWFNQTWLFKAGYKPVNPYPSKGMVSFQRLGDGITHTAKRSRQEELRNDRAVSTNRSATPTIVRDRHTTYSEKSIRFTLAEKTFDFQEVEMSFQEWDLENLFAEKNNKSLGDTVLSPRYSTLSKRIIDKYSSYLEMPLGTFLLKMKTVGDLMYRDFLNSYGDLKYCLFRIPSNDRTQKKGLYLFQNDEGVQYIGRCRDAFIKRFNQGYGKIHPKNCYIDGQATNCHLNSLINGTRGRVKLFICPLEDDLFIERSEKVLIQEYGAPWNIQK